MNIRIVLRVRQRLQKRDQCTLFLARERHAAEIAAASTSLLTLHRNGDRKLSREE